MELLVHFMLCFAFFPSAQQSNLEDFVWCVWPVGSKYTIEYIINVLSRELAHEHRSIRFDFQHYEFAFAGDSAALSYHHHRRRRRRCRHCRRCHRVRFCKYGRQCWQLFMLYARLRYLSVQLTKPYDSHRSSILVPDTVWIGSIIIRSRRASVFLSWVHSLKIKNFFVNFSCSIWKKPITATQINTRKTKKKRLIKMKQSICEIFLNPNGHCDGVYHSGQKLSGNVLLTFYEKQKINSESVAIWCSIGFFLSLSPIYVMKWEECRTSVLINSFCYSSAFQILLFKFWASANVNGVNNDAPIKVKRFT